jgi:hypothetical protein
MPRSYAVALTCFASRCFLGLSGLDRPLNLGVAETVVWICLALSVLAGDLANQCYEGFHRVGGLRRMGGQARGLAS